MARPRVESRLKNIEQGITEIKEKLAKIPCQLMDKETCSALKLASQPYLILIPNSLIASTGITSDSITFDLVINNGKLSLIGPSILNPRVTQSVVEEIDT